MGIELIIPRLNENQMTTKDVIINILAYTWPLTARKIYNQIAKEHGFDVTYQAVHKTLKQLLEREVLIKNGKGYQLNEEWLRSIHRFSETVENYYRNNRSMETPRFPWTLEFETQIDMGKFLLDALDNNLLGDFKEVFCNWSFIWSPLPFSKKEYTQLKSLARKKRVYIVTKDNRFYSRWHAHIWRKLGVRVKTNLKDVPEIDYIVYRPHIIQIFWGKRIRESQSKYMEIIKSAEDLDINEIYEDILERKGEILVTILRDEKLAKKLSEDIIKHFRK